MVQIIIDERFEVKYYLEGLRARWRTFGTRGRVGGWTDVAM